MLTEILSKSGTAVSPELLGILAKKASRMFLEQKVPLTDAVATVIEEHPELGEQHIRRIVEQANTSTFQELFEGNEDKNVHFDVADPKKVLGSRKDTASNEFASNTDYDKTPLSYSMMQKMASEDDQTFAEFETTEPMNNPVQEVYKQHVRMMAIKDHLTDARHSLKEMVKSARADFQKVARQEILNPYGAGLGGVISALEKVASEPSEVAFLMKPVIEDLISTCAASPSQLQASLTKTASGPINYKHPLIASYGAMIKAASDLQKTEIALLDVQAALKDTTAFIKKAFIGPMLAGATKLVGSVAAPLTEGLAAKTMGGLASGAAGTAGRAMTLGGAPNELRKIKGVAREASRNHDPALLALNSQPIGVK